MLLWIFFALRTWFIFLPKNKSVLLCSCQSSDFLQQKGFLQEKASRLKRQPTYLNTKQILSQAFYPTFLHFFLEIFWNFFHLKICRFHTVKTTRYGLVVLIYNTRARKTLPKKVKTPLKQGRFLSFTARARFAVSRTLFRLFSRRGIHFPRPTAFSTLPACGAIGGIVEFFNEFFKTLSARWTAVL